MKTFAQSSLAVVRHIAFRIGIGIASAALTVWLLIGILICIAFMQPYAPLSASENLSALVMGVAFSIPVLFGVVILLPQSRKWARWAGASIVYVVAPGFFVAILSAGYIEPFSEEFSWIVLWLFAVIAYWMILRPIQTSSQGTVSHMNEVAPANGGQRPHLIANLPTHNNLATHKRKKSKQSAATAVAPLALTE